LLISRAVSLQLVTENSVEEKNSRFLTRCKED